MRSSCSPARAGCCAPVAVLLRAALLLGLLGCCQCRLRTFGRFASFERTLELEVGGKVVPQAPGGSKPGFLITEEGKDPNGGSANVPRSRSWPRAWPDAALAGHEQELEKVVILHSLIAPMALNNTVIVVPANLGFLEQALNLRCQLLALGNSNVLLWALDADTADKLKARQVEHFYDSSLYSVSQAVGYGFEGEEKRRMMSERPRVWWRLLATGYDLLFVDADVVALRRPEEGLERSADFEGQLDYQHKYAWSFQSMSNASTICAGVFWVKSSPKSLKLMDGAAASFESKENTRLEWLKSYGRWDDQIALNYMIHDPAFGVILNPSLADNAPRRVDVREDGARLTVLYAHPTKVMGGTLLPHVKTVDGGKLAYKVGEQWREFLPSFIHFNGFAPEEKVRAMKEHGWWQLNDSGSCVTS